MTLDGQLIAPSPVDSLLSKLDEPRIVNALNNLLDHADLLAFLVIGIDGLLARGDAIGEALAETVSEARSAGGAGAADLAEVIGSVSALSGAVVKATPALESLLSSDVIAKLASAVTAGAERAKVEPMKTSGVFSLLKALKDDDVARGLGFLLQVVRAFGHELA